MSIARYELGTVNKALEVLEHLAHHNEETLETLGRALDMPKATVFRLVYTLEKRGYVVRTPLGALGLGPRVLWLVTESKRSWFLLLREAALPRMLELRDLFGDTVNLGTRSGSQLVYIDVVEGTYPVRFVEMPGALGPLHATALGKALLAHLPASELESVLSGLTLRRYTPATITNPDRLAKELAKIRSRGYSIDNGESVEGATCVGAPVLAKGGRPLAAISMAIPNSRLNAEKLDSVRSALLDACRRTEEAMLTAGHE